MKFNPGLYDRLNPGTIRELGSVGQAGGINPGAAVSLNPQPLPPGPPDPNTKTQVLRSNSLSSVEWLANSAKLLGGFGG